jgi:hypothetical protein
VDQVEKKKIGEKNGGKYGKKLNKEQGKKPLQGQNKGAGTQYNEQTQRTKKLECFICGDENYASDCPH